MSKESTRDDKARERLLKRREIDEEIGCWQFTGTLTSNGYGHIHYIEGPEVAHRLSAVFFLGFDLSSGLLVLHRCDQPDCFNPEHPFVGTQKDNLRDADAKGRMGGKKLTPDKV